MYVLCGKYFQHLPDNVHSGGVESVIKLVRDHYKLENVTYHMCHTINFPAHVSFVRTTYSMSWVPHYLLHNLISIDPVALQRNEPFHWSDLTDTVGIKRMSAESGRFGIGASGYSIPLTNKKRRSLLSIDSNMPTDQWRDHIDSIRSEVLGIAHDLHQIAAAESECSTTMMPDLAPREIECLSWTSQGKTYSEIAIIVGISQHTVRAYLRAARNKLDCITLAQAASKAVRHGLFQ